MNKSKFEFRTSLKKKIKFLSFHAVVLVKTFILMYQLATNVGLILTKLWWFQLFSTSQNSNFDFFFFLNQIFGFPCCSTREDLSIDMSITNVGLILTKLRWFQRFSTSQNSNFELFEKKLGFPCCSTREDLSIDVSITNVGLILTKLWWFLFSGYGQMDRQGFWNPHMETCRHTKNFNSKLVVSCRSLYASPEDGDA